MTRGEFVVVFRVIKASYPNHRIFEDEKTVEVWYEKLKDLNYHDVMYTANIYANTNRFPPSIADLRNGNCSIADWSVEWIKIAKGARAYELNEPARYAINVLTWDNVEYCIKENCSRTTQCMKEFERLYNDYTMKNMQRQLIGAELYDDIKQIPTRKELIEAHEEEELPPGAIVLPDGSVDYSEVERNWDW